MLRGEEEMFQCLAKQFSPLPFPPPIPTTFLKGRKWAGKAFLQERRYCDYGPNKYLKLGSSLRKGKDNNHDTSTTMQMRIPDPALQTRIKVAFRLFSNKLIYMY